MATDRRPTSDEDEPGRWIARTIRPALAYAISLVRNRHDAEDVVQECYRRLLARAGEYDLAKDGQKLLYKSITNACINFVQRRPPEVAWENLDQYVNKDSDDGRTPESKLIQQELEDNLGRALAKLPVNQRAAVELAGLGQPLAEVAEILGVSHANARVLVHRARQALAESLKKFVEGEVR